MFLCLCHSSLSIFSFAGYVNLWCGKPGAVTWLWDGRRGVEHCDGRALRQEIWLQQAVFRQQLKHNANHSGLPGGQTPYWLVGLLA